MHLVVDRPIKMVSFDGIRFRQLGISPNLDVLGLVYLGPIFRLRAQLSVLVIDFVHYLLSIQTLKTGRLPFAFAMRKYRHLEMNRQGG